MSKYIVEALCWALVGMGFLLTSAVFIRLFDWIMP